MHRKNLNKYLKRKSLGTLFMKSNLKSVEDVLAVDGRITVIGGLPHAAGKLKFGASSHMARLIIELNKIDPAIRAGINFKSNSHLVKLLKEYCRNKGHIFSFIDRSKEPDEIKEEEGKSMPWKINEAARSAGGKIPKVFYETGGSRQGRCNCNCRRRPY